METAEDARADSGTDERFWLCPVTWDYYERTLEERLVTNPDVRLMFDRGYLEFVRCSPKHMRARKLIAQFMGTYTLERGIAHLPLGFLTCRRQDLDLGIDAEGCYYLRHLPDPDNISLETDPPPDLVVDVDMVPGRFANQGIWAALGVPEVWWFNGQVLTVLHRESAELYRPTGQSLAFPQLAIETFNRYLGAALASRPGEQHRAVKAFQEWVQQGA